MVVAKRILGWLCFLTLLASLCFAGMAVYSYTAPFFRGAYVERYDWNRSSFTSKLSSDLLSRDLYNSGTQDVIEWHALRGPQPTVYKGLEGAINQFGIPVREQSYPDPPVAVAVMDRNGNVVSAYPEELTAKLPRYMPETQDASGHDWAYTFQSMSGLEVSSDVLDYPDIKPLTDRNGAQIGTIAILWRNRPMYAVIPWHTRVHSEISPQTAIIVAASLLVLFYLLLVIWVAMDAAWRGMRPFAWGALVFLTNIFGLIAYVIARLSPPCPCRNCGEIILAKYKRCPSCGISLLKRCPVCRAKLKPGWQFCPNCSTTPGNLFAGSTNTERKETVVHLPESPVSPPVKQPELRVVVVDSATGAPVANAQVSIQGPVRLDGQTNLTGTFEAKSLKEGDYTVTATKSGYDSACVDTNVVPDKLTESKVEMQLLPGGIRGRVRDIASQKPVVRAYVYPDSSRLDVSTHTDESGEFELNSIPAGPYTIIVNADGFVSQTRLAEVLPGKQVTLDFTLEVAEEVPSEV